MSITNTLMNRRRVLRGAAGITVGLPFLDCFLTENGTALAASNTALPVCFGTWWQGLGFTQGRWVPDKVGAGYENKVELRALTPYRDRMNIISGTKYFLDGRPLETHTTGWQIASQGMIPLGINSGPSLDSQIADVIGTRTRFRSIEISLDGTTSSYSKRAGSASNPSEGSPSKLYTRIFGPEYKDPNAAEFVPDTDVMVRKSVLTGVTDERQALMSRLGAADRAKMDNYFTSLRALEQKLAIQLEKPAPMVGCTKPAQAKNDDGHPLTLALEAMERHNIFAGLLAHALACGQTRVVNLAITQGMSGLRKEGDTTSHHTQTHEEPVDSTLGYQKNCAWFQGLYMQALADFATTFDGIKEGDKSMLDRMVIFAFTDHGAPRLHSVRNYPLMTLGTGDGRMKVGMHVPKSGDAVTRIGLTVMQAMGVPLSAWGTQSNRVTSPIAEVLV